MQGANSAAPSSTGMTTESGGIECIDNRSLGGTLARRRGDAKPAQPATGTRRLTRSAAISDAAALAVILAQHPAAATLVPGLRAGELVPMREKGVAHAHFSLPRHGLVLRVPRLSQWALPPAENLAYQAACFRRAEPSGATPRLRAVLPVSADLPRGALLVEAIVGRPPRLPAEMSNLATALARLHALPLPVPADRPPLADHSRLGPIAGTLAVIERQVPALDDPGLPAATRDALLQELAWRGGSPA